jgi:hypothetical protein
MIWDVTEQKWRFPKGESVNIYVGASSRNLPLVSGLPRHLNVT